MAQVHEILSSIGAVALGGGDEKTPGLIPPGAKFYTAWGKTGKSNPRRAIILARRWHGRGDGERAAEAAPQFQLAGLISTFGTNNWPARANISCRSFDVRCWQMRTFQLGHFGSE
jgi:hypothetical protein